MQVFPNYLSNLTSFLVFSFALLLVSLFCISYLGLLMSLTTTTNQVSLVWIWISYGLLNVVVFGYVRQFLGELLLLIAGKYFIMGLSDITMTNL